jgi:hypothetical protein
VELGRRDKNAEALEKRWGRWNGAEHLSPALLQRRQRFSGAFDVL